MSAKTAGNANVKVDSNVGGIMITDLDTGITPDYITFNPSLVRMKSRNVIVALLEMRVASSITYFCFWQKSMFNSPIMSS